MVEMIQPDPAAKPADPLAALRCVVLVEAGSGEVEILWQNGDESIAQRKAEAWCLENPGKRAWVMVATSPSPCRAEIAAKWQRQ